MRVVLVRGYAFLELRAVLLIGVASLGFLVVSVIRVVFFGIRGSVGSRGCFSNGLIVFDV